MWVSVLCVHILKVVCIPYLLITTINVIVLLFKKNLKLYIIKNMFFFCFYLMLSMAYSLNTDIYSLFTK